VCPNLIGVYNYLKRLYIPEILRNCPDLFLARWMSIVKGEQAEKKINLET
jgi:hypothetical protein